MNLLEVVTPVAAEGLFSYAWLLIAIPAVSAAILLLVGKAGDAWGHLLGTLAPIASFVIGVALFVQLVGREESARAVGVPVYTWITSGRWDINVGLLVDQLSIVFVLLITGVGSLIHVYSIGYMAHDERRRRFFGFLNLFVAAMLLLVLADNYLVLFVGWEGVGLASYLLISFWQHKPSAAVAGKKAFVVNRVGDLGMSVAIMLMLAAFGSSAFVDVNAGAAAMPGGMATVMGLLLLLGACGKSAQVPLQSWLLDAMEGPTPVSALIHAATMVTAGVYLVTRSFAIFEQTEAAATAVVIVGTVTLLAGAWIGCAKDDIKKALAGSTMSQIGYMMLAAGIGPAGYAFAIFHLLTHGFFKANMFLGAGSVMHGMDDDVNMRHYGALSRAMPVTFITFAAGYLAIIGFPFFSGFYSKDHIIEAAFEHSALVGVLAMLGAGVTAFYMTRLMLMTFLGQKRWLAGCAPARVAGGDDGAADHPRLLLLRQWPAAEQLDRRLAGSRVRDRPRRGARAEPAARDPGRHRHLAAGGRRGGHRLRRLRSPQGHPADRAAEPFSLHPRRPQRPVRRRAERGGADATRPAAQRRSAAVGGRRHRRGGERDRIGDHPGLGPAPQGAERFRAVVRADHGPRGRGGRCCDRPRTARLGRS